ncbi:MAG: hypothetical protein ROO76_12285 [Terriglobia bacterium]|jgi:hypothetical protein|nr:hypothetical protein [Terriglobia bacterium]
MSRLRKSRRQWEQELDQLQHNVLFEDGQRNAWLLNQLGGGKNHLTKAQSLVLLSAIAFGAVLLVFLIAVLLAYL